MVLVTILHQRWSLMIMYCNMIVSLLFIHYNFEYYWVGFEFVTLGNLSNIVTYSNSVQSSLSTIAVSLLTSNPLVIIKVSLNITNHILLTSSNVYIKWKQTSLNTQFIITWLFQLDTLWNEIITSYDNEEMYKNCKC